MPDGALASALEFVPEDATVLTVTDWDAIRGRLGVPELDGEATMTDRFAFWERARAEAVLLTEGALREDNSTFELDYGFTADDVEWEAHWTGEDGPGYVLQLRDGLDLDGVRRAVDAGEGVLDGAHLDADRRLVVEGSAAEPDDSWDDSWAAGEATSPPAEGAESIYLRKGCVPFDEVLGPDATVEDQDAVLAKHDIAALESVDSVAITYAGKQVTGWLPGPIPGPRGDLTERAALFAEWPTTDLLSLTKAFKGVAVAGDGITATVKDPLRAATVTLADILPFGVCNQVKLLPEPTGLE